MNLLDLIARRIGANPERLREHLTAAPNTLAVLKQTGLLHELTRNPIESYRALGGQRPSLKNLHRIMAAKEPNRIAVCDLERLLTYAEMDEAIDRVAALLRSRFGIAARSRVVLMSENRVEYLVFWFALLRLGAAAVHASFELRPAELDHVLRNSGAGLICASSQALPVASAATANFDERTVELLHIDGLETADADSGSFGESVASLHHLFRATQSRDFEAGDDGESVVYTSGTTGRPKGAVRNFSAMTITELTAILERLPFVAGERHMVVGRLYHSAAQAFTGLITALGGTLVLRPRFDAANLFDDLRRERIESLFLVPNMLDKALTLEPIASRTQPLPHLRAIVCGAAPFLQPLRERAAHRLGAGILNDFYGATELGWVTCVNGHEMLKRPATLGRAIRGHEITIRDADGALLPANTVGVVWTRSAQRMERYLGDEGATSDIMKAGWTTCEDLGFLDSEGYLFLAGRARELIISGGINVYPAEVEAALLHHPAIADAAVFGLPDAQWGESVATAIVLREPITAGELRRWALSEMLPAKAPRRWFIVDELPRNPTGKIMKRELQQRYAEPHESSPA